MNSIKPILEVCAGDIESVAAAAAGGAYRVELCSALGEGGVTPSVGFIKKAVEVPKLKVHVLIRPRGGDFVYTADEVDAMVTDIEMCKSMGVDGVVIGALTPDGDIDIEASRRMIAAAGNMSVTFHRAFDLCRYPMKALEEIISLGCDRILTSGQAASALEGVDLLKNLVEQANGRIIILAGGGVNPSNAAEILSKSKTSEIHASARATIHSPMRYHKEGVSMGTPGSDEYSRKVTSSKIVGEIVKNISK